MEPTTLNYRGDRTDVVIGTPLGPDQNGEWVYVHAAEYDSTADKTTLTVSKLIPAGVTLEEVAAAFKRNNEV